MTAQLNQDQQDAVKMVSAFIVGPEKEFFLTGGPGVGKTFTTRELALILPKIIQNYRRAMQQKGNPKEIALTSTTNKAATVLGEQTGILATTIHSFLGVVPKTDYSTGRTHLKRTNKYQVHQDKIIFIDEASMVDKELYVLLQEATDPTCKIIYIGDKNQLAPVMEKISPAVALANVPAQTYEITTPVRNANAPALLDLCDRLKDDILLENPKDKMTNWPAAPGEIEYVNGEQLKILIEGMFGPNGTVKVDDEELACRILCYRNDTVVGYNQHIRKLRGLPEHPTPGEVLVCNDHFKLSRDRSFSVEEAVTVHAVSDPQEFPICEHNSIMAYELDVSSRFNGRTTVRYCADRDRMKLLRRHYKKHKDWPSFFKLKEDFIDLRDREAATVYKAQGSTYDSVIMIMSDIFASRDINQLRRMLYVGASRARKKIYLYDRDIHTNARGIYK